MVELTGLRCASRSNWAPRRLFVERSAPVGLVGADLEQVKRARGGAQYLVDGISPESPDDGDSLSRTKQGEGGLGTPGA